MNETSLNLIKEDEVDNAVYARLRTSYWSDRSGVYKKMSLVFLRRKCKGVNVVEEDVNDIGSDEVFPRIINLNDCDDGIYRIIMIDVRRDWESGYIEDWNYKLIKDI
jgi:hypothetical protein